MKKEIKIEKDTIISAGNYIVLVGKYSTGDIAIVSKSNGEKFCQFKNIRKGGKLKRIKIIFRANLCSSTELCFSHMSEESTLRLINILRKK